jgi:hypothetical protein
LSWAAAERGKKTDDKMSSKKRKNRNLSGETTIHLTHRPALFTPFSGLYIPQNPFLSITGTFHKTSISGKCSLIRYYHNSINNTSPWALCGLMGGERKNHEPHERKIDH